MRSPPGRAAATVLALAVAMAAVVAASMASRGLYGVALDGVVARVEVRHEKRPPADDVHLVHVDGNLVHVDAALAARLRRGDRVEKRRLAGAARVEGRRVELSPSRDLRRSAIVLPAMLVLVGALLALPRQ